MLHRFVVDLCEECSRGSMKRPNPLGLKCDIITSPGRLVNTFMHQMIPDMFKTRQTYKGGDQL
jgi:hypothetical protein